MFEPKSDDPYSPARCRKRAMDALARREHSRLELERKLTKIGFPEDTISTTLDKLAAERLQCDERFVEMFVASRYRRGKGPQRIRAELADRGVSEAMVERELADPDFDWCAVAARVRESKFGEALPDDFPTRAKQMRFLQYRGYDAGQINAAMRKQRD